MQKIIPFFLRKHFFVSLVMSLFLINGQVGISQAIMVTATEDPNVLVQSLLGPGANLVAITNSQIASLGGGIFTSAGTFSGGLVPGPSGLPTGLGFDSGIILSTGLVNFAVGPNANTNDIEGPTDDLTIANGTPGDIDLNALVSPNSTNDATVLEFTFDTGGAVVDLSVNYVFASEEYNDFVNKEFNDVFGFFVDGVNIALVPGTGDLVSVNTINELTNPNFFLCNNNPVSSTEPCIEPPGPYDLAYDGFTTVLTATATSLQPGMHTMKFAIADTFDFEVDSAVFIESASFTVFPSDPPPPRPSNPIPEPSTMILLGSGLIGLVGWRLRR